MSRAMVVVAAGSGTRFEKDKMLTPVDGVPLVKITIARITPHVDRCVLVCRASQIDLLEELDLDITLAVGGATRTASEMAGLKALNSAPDVIGIHDGARPNPSPAMIEELFATAEAVGGAVPVFDPAAPLFDRDTLEPLEDVKAVQTPQVFRGKELVDAYRSAEAATAIAHDTLAIVQQFTDLEVAPVDGTPTNIKVTYPADLERVIPL